MNYIILSLLGVLLVLTLPPVFASTGMSNCNDEDENNDNPDCNDQPDRVGNDNDDDESPDADRDGPGGDDETPDEEEDDGDSNCWGKVTSSLTQNEDGKPGIGEHSSDPRPGDDDNETPREGVGNQNEGHPSDHADVVGGLADEQPDCVD